jgi:multiple sugar transport system substrate-binding protein
MKKSLHRLLVISLILSTMFFAGVYICSAGDDDKPLGEVEITIWQHSYPPLNDWTKGHIADFMEMHPNISVNYELVPFEEWNQKIFTALATKQGPHFFESDDYTFAQFMKNDQLAVIEPEFFGFDSVKGLTDDYEGKSLDLVTFDGKLYGIPYDWEAPVIGYNIRLFKEAGIDPQSIKTWDDAMKAAAKIAKRDAGGILTTAGLAMVHNIDVYYQLQGTTLFNQAGVEILNEDNTKCTINTPKVYKIFEFWRDNIHKYKTDDPGFTSSFYTQEFGEGRVGMGYMLVWANSILAPAGYVNGRDFDLIKIPTFKGGSDISISYSWNWVLNAENSKEENEAATMLMAYLSEQGDTYLTEAGLINPRKGWKERAPKDELDKYTEIIASLEKSKPIMPYVKFNEVWSAIIKVFKAVEVDPDADIPALIDACEKEINEIIQ